MRIVNMRDIEKTKPNQTQRTLGVAVVLLVLGAAVAYLASGTMTAPPTFDENRALADAAYQLSLGPRIFDSDAHRQTVEWIVSQTRAAGWQVEIQEIPYALLDENTAAASPIRNVVARRGKGQPWIILGAHYDSRLWADQDQNTNARRLPVPGANDGASGVAVLLELARALPKKLDKQIWLVFFDAEDNGQIPGWDWILGSRGFVEKLVGRPDAVVIVDMIGDADLNIYLERNSNAALSTAIWQTAASLGYTQFIPQYKYNMLDDHTPFLQAGIPAVDIIDFDYPYWHTTADTLDKLSAQSLDAVGETLLAWLTGD